MSDSIELIARTAGVAVAAYFALLILVRIAGKRLMSKWNAFDSVVTIAMGSSLATAILSRQTSLLQGVTAFATLIGLQFALTWLSVRIRKIDTTIKARPRLLFSNGKALPEAMKEERVAESELLAAIRSHGVSDLRTIQAVVLETDGSISVLVDPVPDDGSALKGVRTK